MTGLPTKLIPIRHPLFADKGFSLVELAVVLVIVGLLASGLMLSLGTQRETATTQEAQRQLENIREAVIGFALANGRLPCPALSTLANTDSNAGRENCTLQHGVVPWATLGLPEVDPWGNRFSYCASQKFTTPPSGGAQAGFTLTTGSPNADPPDNAGTANVISGGANVASDLPGVIISHGQRSAGAFTPSGSQIPRTTGDEDENADTDFTFVAHAPTPTFDDQLIWIVPAILKSRMVAAGKLP